MLKIIHLLFFCLAKAVIQKWNFKEVAKFSDKNKKGKKLLLEFVAASGAEAREFEVENKADLPLLLARFEEVRNKVMIY